MGLVNQTEPSMPRAGIEPAPSTYQAETLPTTQTHHGTTIISFLITGRLCPARVAQLVERLPSTATNLGSISGWGHDPAMGWGDTMLE